MSTIVFSPSRLSGCAVVPAAKSEAHRAILLAALGRGECELRGFVPPLCDDTEAMISGVRALGAEVRREDGSLIVVPAPPRADEARFNVKACAAALRMLIPAFLARGQRARIAMSEGLYRRPLDAFSPLADRLGATLVAVPPADDRAAEVAVDGLMPAGDYAIDGSLSSQFASGMLIALAHAARERKPAPSTLTVEKPIVSRPYLDMTLALMRRFGIEITEREEGVFDITPAAEASPERLALSGDWSQAAVLLCADALGGGVMLEGMRMDGGAGLQGDARIAEVLAMMGLRLMYTRGALFAVSPSKDALSPIALDCSDIPDIAPIIALVCARARGRSTLTGVGRLRAKECDRLAATAELLGRLGAKVEASDDALTIWGGAPLRGGFTADARGDHRMVMLLAVAALAADKPIAVTGAEAISKSWPGFIDTYKSLGGVVS